MQPRYDHVSSALCSGSSGGVALKVREVFEMGLDDAGHLHFGINCSVTVLQKLQGLGCPPSTDDLCIKSESAFKFHLTNFAEP